MELIPFDNRHENRLRDESRTRGAAEWLALPACAAELAECLRFAADKGLKTVVQGARTGITGAAVPHGGLVIGTDKLNRIAGVERRNGYAFLRAEAGVTLRQIADYTAKPVGGKKLFFAPNPTEKSATLGGMFACNAEGLNALRYGGTRVNTRARYVTPDGRTAETEEIGLPPDGLSAGGFSTSGFSAGGFSAGGFSANGFSTGGFSTNGFSAGGFSAGGFSAGGFSANGLPINGLPEGAAIYELELLLLPRPRTLWGAVYFFREEQDALGFAVRLWRRCTLSEGVRDITVACEYFNSAVLRLLRGGRRTAPALQALPELPEGVCAAVYAELAGNDDGELERELERHLELFAHAGGSEEHTWAAGTEQEAEKFREMRHCATELVNAPENAARRGECVYGSMRQGGIIAEPGL
jgi:D-lactate dehydrogenase (cytochrome)